MSCTIYYSSKVNFPPPPCQYYYNEKTEECTTDEAVCGTRHASYQIRAHLGFYIFKRTQCPKNYVPLFFVEIETKKKCERRTKFPEPIGKVS